MTSYQLLRPLRTQQQARADRRIETGRSANGWIAWREPCWPGDKVGTGNSAPEAKMDLVTQEQRNG